MNDVLFFGVVGRQIGAAAEPQRAAATQAAEVGVHRRHHRALRVQHQRDSARREGEPVAGQVGGEFGLELAVHRRVVDARLLEERALGQNPRAPTAAARPLPGVLAKFFAAVGRFEPCANSILERGKRRVRLGEDIHLARV